METLPHYSRNFKSQRQLNKSEARHSQTFDVYAEMHPLKPIDLKDKLQLSVMKGRNRLRNDEKSSMVTLKMNAIQSSFKRIVAAPAIGDQEASEEQRQSR